MNKVSILTLALVSGIVFLSGCGGAAPVSNQPAAQPKTPLVEAPAPQRAAPISQPAQPATAPVPSKPQLSNRVDIIYFHMNQRCVTCLCFEEHVNHVIEAYFGDAIATGKLTYRVLNAQEKPNAEIAKKYKVVGSQLFINSVVNEFDNIEDIQDIWNWDCRNDPRGFELKVKNVIEARLNGNR
jgi:hypothetical protein